LIIKMKLFDITNLYEDSTGVGDASTGYNGPLRATTWSSIRKVLADKGYTELGYGAEQIAFLEPGTGLVLKIFGEERLLGHGNSATDEQKLKSFMKWVDFCTMHKSNPFLPKYHGWSRFMSDQNTFLQIRTDRLYELPEEKYASTFGPALVRLVRYADSPGSSASNQAKYLNTIELYDKDTADKHAQLLLLIGGRAKFNLFWDTVNEVIDYGKHMRLNLDLHAGNFMLTSEGDPIINDPYYGDKHSGPDSWPGGSSSWPVDSGNDSWRSDDSRWGQSGGSTV
tara:strand:+ start:911 stop:1756 length:846 start_codon:yes stop_codon:yes gene_type:complete